MEHFSWNRMVELNIALKRSELVFNKSASLGKLGHFVITSSLVILKITVCKGIEVWVPIQQWGCTFHMTCKIIYYEIPRYLKKNCIFVWQNYCKYIYSTTSWQWLMIFCKREHWEGVMVVIDLLLLGCIGLDDCNVYLLAFKLLTLY